MKLKKILDFLHTPFVDRDLIFLDWFSFAHLAFGFVTIFIMLKLTSDVPFAIIFSFFILAAWELFEVYSVKNKRFYIRPDKLTNSLWDLIVGAAGIAIFLSLNGLF